MLWRKRVPSEAEEWQQRFNARVEEQRAAAMVPTEALIQKVLEVHYRQMLSNPAARRQVARWIQEVDRVEATGTVRRRRP